MKGAISSTILAVALAAVGGVCWTLGRAERELASSQQQLMMMRYGVAAEPAPGRVPALRYTRLVPGVATGLLSDARDTKATAEYWSGRYDVLTASRDTTGAAVDRDPAQLLVASNAAFRVTQIETVDRQTALTHLENVIKSYADALKANPEQVDAAYNYEFVVRMRDTLARARGAAATSKISIAETTPTIHGRPGGPPKGVSMSNFKVLVPKQSDERNGGDEASKGGQKARKG